MLESDWKTISEMMPTLRERYLAEQNARLARMLTETGRSETERFWDTLAEMKRQSKNLRDCLNDYSRSNMWLHMRAMVNVGMLRKADLVVFSGELQKELADSLPPCVRVEKTGYVRDDVC